MKKKILNNIIYILICVALVLVFDYFLESSKYWFLVWGIIIGLFAVINVHDD